MQKWITAVTAAALMMNMGITASAAERLDRDYVEAEIWEEIWVGKGDDGTEFPEASYKHHLLDKWVDAEYGSADHDWSSIGELKRDYKNYYRKLIKGWDFEDKDGKWTIETEDDLYSFTMLNGTWQMLDSSGNTVDSFPPFSTLEEYTKEADNGHDITEGDDYTAVKNDIAGRTETASESVSAESRKVTDGMDTSSSERKSVASKATVIGLLAVGGAVAALFVFKKKKK